MTETILTHDEPVSAFEDAGGVVSTDDNDGISFQWDEEHIVRVDAPSDLEGAFDTDRFYKVEDATIARPIKQPYLVGDDIEWYKKPADELRKTAWSFDNKPFTLGHPETGMVKDVSDIHGFWRNVHYVDDEDRLNADLYVPANDEAALDWLEEHSDVSVGFYNRVNTDYDGDTGDLTDDDVDGFQVDMYGNHVAGVKQGRCSGEDGCGLDSEDAQSGSSVNDSSQSASREDWTHGEVIMATDEPTIDTPDESEESSGSTDSDSTTEDCGCTTMTDDNTEDGQDFDIPDLSIDALAKKNDAVDSLKAERDSLREDLDEMKTEIEDALDAAEHFSVELDEDECPCEAVDELVSDLDEKVEQVEDLEDELSEYREDEIEDRLDTLEDLGAERDEWEEEADEADDPLDALDEEIERREEVLEAADGDMSVKDIDSSTDEDSTDSDETTISGTRTFGRGHGA